MSLTHFKFGPISFSWRSATQRRYFYAIENDERMRSVGERVVGAHSRRVFADEDFEVTTVEFGDGGRPHPVRMLRILEDHNVFGWRG